MYTVLANPTYASMWPIHGGYSLLQFRVFIACDSGRPLSAYK